MTDENEPTEVFILSQYDAVVVVCLSDEFIIHRPLHKFGYSNNVIAIRAHYTHDREIAAFVGEEAQSRVGRAGCSKTVSWANAAAAYVNAA